MPIAASEVQLTVRSGSTPLLAVLARGGMAVDRHIFRGNQYGGRAFTCSLALFLR